MAETNLRYHGIDTSLKQDSTLYLNKKPKEDRGGRMMLGHIKELIVEDASRPKFKWSKSGVVTSWTFKDADRTAGVVTTGQSQCISIIALTLSDNMSGRVDRATFLHHSVAPHISDTIKDFVRKADAHGAQWLVIAGQTSRMDTMEALRDNLWKYADANTGARLGIPQERIFIYDGMINQDEFFGFGFDATGRIGQVDGWWQEEKKV